MRKRIRFISMLVACVMLLLSITTNSYAGVTDIKDTDSYAQAVERLMKLGIINGNEGNFNPDKKVTKEEFATIMVLASGLKEEAQELKIKAIFPDVALERWSSGYIALATEKGFVTGELDGSFAPQKEISYAQLCTVVVTALGYKPSDLTGVWPYSYINKATKLGLTDGIELNATDCVPKWVLAKVIDRLLITNMKGMDKSFAENTGSYTQMIVLENSSTKTELNTNEVITEKGIYYLADGVGALESGNQYIVSINSNTITAVAKCDYEYTNISVKSVSGASLQYIESERKRTITLPENTAYYKNGQKVSYSQAKEALSVNASVVLCKKPGEYSYEYAVVYEPVYNKPYLVNSLSFNQYNAEGLSLTNKQITKNGSIIDADGLELNDVIYEVSDIWNKNSYILVISKEISGEITEILPNKLSPKAIKIGNEQYELDSYMNSAKLTESGIFSVGDYVTAFLGHENKVVDIKASGTEDNSDYALIVDVYSKISSKAEDFGTTNYYVNLLTADNIRATYQVEDDDYLALKGKLVRFNVNENSNADFDGVELEEIEYPAVKSYVVNKDERMIDDKYLADNVVIFDLVKNVYGTDSEARLLSWSDFLDGKIEVGKIKYIATAGAFNDINVILTENLLDKDYCLGVVTNKTTTFKQGQSLVTYTIAIGGVNYTYSTDSGFAAFTGSVVEVRVSNGKILDLIGTVSYIKASTKVQAIDSKRIKVGGVIYRYNSDITIYMKNYDGVYEKIGINEVEVNKEYVNVTVFTDRPVDYCGRAEIILIN